MADEIVTKICCGICGISALTLVILLIVSFSSLEINEYGLDYSSISKTVNSSPYVGGIHFLGVGHSFIKYPKTVQTIEFSGERSANGPVIQSRTQDGLEVNLEISFQYKVILENLYQLYFTYNDQYQKVCEKVAIDVLTEIATNYTAYDFFVDRMKIGTSMQEALNNEFKNSCFSTIDFFQLRSVDLPDKFEEAIQLSEVKKQEIQKAYAEKNKTQVELDTQWQIAAYQRNITLNMAAGEAQAILAQGKANANSIKMVNEANSKSYTSLKGKLKLTNYDLLGFIKGKLIRDYNGTNLVVALDNMEELGKPKNSTSSSTSSR